MTRFIAVTVLTVASCVSAAAQEGHFGGLLGSEEDCRVERWVECENSFCKQVAARSLANLKLDFVGRTLRRLQVDTTPTQFTVVEESAEEINRPLWVKFDFRLPFFENKLTHGTIYLNPDQSGDYAKTIAISTDELTAGVTSIFSGTCGPIGMR